MRKSLALIVLAFGARHAAAEAVVSNGRFTNIYVFPNSDKETWEQHIAKLRKADVDKFSRASIDRFTQELMTGWPGYFDPLVQWGVHPPRYFGSAVASKKCVEAALKDVSKAKVLQVNTIRSLANCHIDGMDPSPQVNLIFSPDIKIAAPSVGTQIGVSSSPEMCTTTNTRAYHSGGVNVPNFTVISTSDACAPAFTDLTRLISHEVVETVTDPAGFGVGGFVGELAQGKDPTEAEIGDTCEGKGANNPNHLPVTTTYKGYTVARYWSNADGRCMPDLDPPDGSRSEMWLLGESVPLKRFTGDVHDLALVVPAKRVVTDADATRVRLFVQTGGDDLRAGSNAADNADAVLAFAGGTKVTVNLNKGKSWENGETHGAVLDLPAHLRVSDITGVTIKTHFTGGLSGDNWNVDKVALEVSFPEGSKTKAPSPVIVHDWLDISAAPLVRFTGDVHDFQRAVPAADDGKPISALELIVSTGNDDLRGGSNAGDNCDVTIELATGPPIVVHDANSGRTWKGWTDHVVAIPLPKGGLKGGDIKAVKLHTGFGGGIGGDNWNVNRLQLRATLK